MADKPVYSTATGSAKGKRDAKGGKGSDYVQAAGPAKMRLETGGRGGKTVTVLFNLPLSEGAADELKRALQDKLGCGATLKNSTIELRGDLRTRVEAHFAAIGMKLVRAGG